MSSAWAIELCSRSVAETLAIGLAIGGAMQEGDVLALVGELGAGKTHLAKGLARGLGVADDRAVTSPTFVLINEYRGRCVVHHIDAYRLRSGAELAAVGFDELCEGGAVVLVEWADRVREVMPPGCGWLTIEATGESTRRLRLESEDARLASRLAAAGLDQWRAAVDKS
ncbi:tRNA threonylcarbamoyladenosine biosynthesis protein TsaE [Phycisphaerae bacterium RAS2]|nr:tRNA threonylcarbamoyladenosine biosynthesis protein TsaE [Phycisphaerae bacterium RAS2]